MNEQKSLLTHLSGAVDRYRAERRAIAPERGPSKHPGWLRWLGRQMMPNIGTLLLVVILLLTVPSLAAPSRAPSAASTSVISYQGRLADSDGNPVTEKKNMEFRLYDVPTGGTPLWTEMWTGGNAVDVSDGLFNVMLGSIDTTLAFAIEGHDELYLGITVGTDSEMEPRVQLGSVPFSLQAMTVPDGSITTAKLENSAVTSTKIQDGAVTQAKAPTLVWARAHGGDGVKIEIFTVTCSGGGGCDYWFTAGFSETPMILKSAFDHLEISDYGPSPTNHEALHAVSEPNSTHMLLAIGR